MERTVAKVSGATLGYIVGNIPGAYYGYKLGGMAPMYRKRKSNFGGRKSYKKPKGNWKVSGSSSRRKSNIVTTQKDYGTQYVKKRMPRYKKRAWKKFTNKVKAVNRKELGLKTVVYNESVTCFTDASIAQNAVAIHLFGVRGAGASNNRIGGNDLVRLFANDPSVAQGAGPSNPSIGKFLFSSAVLDVTLHNTGDTDMELDLYYGYHRKDVISGNMVGDDFLATSLELPINGGVPNTTLDIQQRGVTPFDLSTGLSQSGYHILKKQKMFLRSSQTSFFQYRDSKNHTLEWNRLKQCGYASKGLTYSIMAVFKPVTGSGTNSTLAIGATRKYSYCEQASTKDLSALNP